MKIAGIDSSQVNLVKEKPKRRRKTKIDVVVETAPDSGQWFSLAAMMI